MLYRKIAKEIEEYYASSRNALLLTGARQTGKTYSIRKFGKSFKSFVELNFIENPDAVKLFDGVTDAKTLLFRLSALVDEPLIPGETLIFFDEVQVCPDIVTAIKFLVDEGSYRYILSGSLLGVELNNLRSEPVGYMGIKTMYPLCFEEFVLNVGVSPSVIDVLKEKWEKREQIDEVVHNKFMELFRLYLVVGGMPAAVASYIDTNNLMDVLTVQNDIVELYRRDISKYAEKDKLEIKEIFDLIPSELKAKNKRFILKSLNRHAKFNNYKDSFLWLKDAGVAIPVYNVEEPKSPLKLAETRNLFKLFSNDVGLLAAQYADGIQRRILEGDKDLNFGSVYENAVAQELVAAGYAPYYYNNKKRGELDFVIQENGSMLPIEVKSGKDYESHRALSNVLQCREFDIREALVLSGHNLSVNGPVVYAPIYMTMFLHREADIPTHYAIDLSALNKLKQS